MALADLAKFNLNEPVSLRDISLRQVISLVYLEQLFSKLKKNRIVTSVRGNKGGYILSKQASEIKISDVFVAVDEKVSRVKKKLTQTQSLKKSLMQDLLTGKVRVTVN